MTDSAPVELVAKFKSRHAGGWAEFQLLADKMIMNFEQSAQHLNDRSTVRGEQTFQLKDLNPTPARGTIRIRRMGVVLLTIMIAIGVVSGTSKFQESHGHSDEAYLLFTGGMVLLIVAILYAAFFAWKSVMFRGYSFRTGANAFTVIQGNRSAEEFTQFCDRLEAAIVSNGV